MKRLLYPIQHLKLISIFLFFSVIFYEAFAIDGFIVATTVQTKLGASKSCNGKAKVDIEPDQEREVGQFTLGRVDNLALLPPSN
ncbi:hypothetical protein IFM89_008147 [Coptis chinensis]|uniref:Uncharacterized protein n=1 Tax=Coptis chinensis TaxID=261450 RepID=A0A835IVL0_9MAGN|nr:hypothetical protein IFM89_008147 [Coptis chinensis]